VSAAVSAAVAAGAVAADKVEVARAAG
jgi:hypothetical protein